ncbi:MAG: hypothetical protein ACXADC_07365 [Candidatus Thorarchaeota archaeon]|jgi:hypothetical protein
MNLGFPRRIALLLILVTLLAPYSIIEWSLLGGTSIRIVAPIWSLISLADGPYIFEFPVGLTIDYLPFWGMGLIIAGVTHFSLARNGLTKMGYAIVVFILLILQLGYSVVIGYLIATGPSLSITPLPVVALLALMFAPFFNRFASSSRESGPS